MTTTAGPAPEALLPPDADVDAVTLLVGDLAAMSAYYREALALTPVSERDGVTVLGRAGLPVVVLRHAPGLPLPGRGQAGLFHTAVLLPDPAALAATVQRAAQHPRSRYVGSADHLVSTAFYFTDPEGNGIELYQDRDRSLWSYRGGRVQMASLPLDPGQFLQDHLTEDAQRSVEATGATVGHVHLQVGDVGLARRFYVDTLGFETTAELPGALFVSAGGYHHHLAMNTWNSAGAPRRVSTLGLAEVAVTVPHRDALDALAVRLRAAGVALTDDGRTIAVEDPWGNRVAVSAVG